MWLAGYTQLQLASPSGNFLLPAHIYVNIFNPVGWLLSLHGAGCRNAATFLRAAARPALMIYFAKSNKSCVTSTLERTMHTDGYSRHSLPLAQKLLFRKACCAVCASALSLCFAFSVTENPASCDAQQYIAWCGAAQRAIGVRRVPRDANLGLWARNVTVAAAHSI